MTYYPTYTFNPTIQMLNWFITKRILFSIISLVALSSNPCSTFALKHEQKNELVIEKHGPIGPKKFEKTFGHTIVKLKIPLINNPSYQTELWKAVKTKLFKDMKVFKEDMKAEGVSTNNLEKLPRSTGELLEDKYFKKIEKTTNPNIIAQVMCNYLNDLTYKTKSHRIHYELAASFYNPRSNIIVIEIKTSSHMGGHTTNDQENYLYNAKTLQPLNLKNMISDTQLDLLAKLTEQKLENMLGHPRDNKKEVSFQDFKNRILEIMNVTSKGIVVRFNRYEVGPGSDGAPEVEISDTELPWLQDLFGYAVNQPAS